MSSESITNSGDVALLLSLTTACFVDVLSGTSFLQMQQQQTRWYATIRHQTWLNKRLPWQLFPTVWTALYVLIIAAMYIAFTTATVPYPHASVIVGWAFLVNIVLNKCWAPVFFQWHQSYGALAIVASLCGLNGLIEAELWYGGFYDSFWIFMPYTLWCLFALVLNLEWCYWERELRGQGINLDTLPMGGSVVDDAVKMELLNIH